MAPSAKVHVVSSSGGHLELLLALRPALGAYERIWLTSKSRRAEELRRSGERVHWLPSWDQRTVGIRAVLRGCRLAAQMRPRVVVTTGAGMVVPYCLVARLLGAKVVFIETMARIASPSLSGRVLSRIASCVLVQWPEMTRVYRRAVLCRPVLLEDLREQPPTDGRGTFAAVGTHTAPFDRLLSAVDQAVGTGLLPGPVRAQTGVSTYRPQFFAATAWMTPEALEDAIGDSRYIVCHTGSGMVSAALRAGRRPLVIPRLREHGEHVDDHQDVVASKLADLDLVVRVQGPLTAEYLAQSERPLTAPAALSASPPLVEELDRVLRGLLSQPAPSTPFEC